MRRKTRRCARGGNPNVPSAILLPSAEEYVASPPTVDDPTDAALRRLVHISRAALESTNALVLFSDERGHLHRAGKLADGRTIEEPVARRILGAASGRVLVRDAHQSVPVEGRALLQAGLQARSFVAVPFADAVRSVRGLLVGIESSPREWRVGDLDLLRELADGALFRRSLLQEITIRRRREEELALLQALTTLVFEAPDAATAIERVLERVCQFAGWPYGEAWLVDTSGERLVAAPRFFGARNDEFLKASRHFTFGPEEGLPGRVWSARRPIWENDLTRKGAYVRRALAKTVGVSAGVGVPVMAHDDVVCVLVFHSTENLLEDERLTSVIATVAAQLGSVLRAKQTEEERWRADERLRAVFDATFQFVGLLTPAGTLLDANRAALEFSGLERDAVVGQDFRATPWWSAPNARALLDEGLARAANGEFVRFETTHESQGRCIDVDFSLSPITNEAGEVVLLVPEGRDITARRSAERELEATRARLDSIISDAADGIVELDRDGLVTLANPAALRLLGRSRDATLGKSFHALAHHTDSQGAELAFDDTPLYDALCNGQTVRTDAYRLWRADGSYFAAEYSATPHGRGAERLGVILVFRDITERARLELALQHEANHDALTGLCNRRGFLSRGEEILARFPDHQATLFFFDLDGFKKINDAHGHRVGDEALVDFATVLRTTLSADDVLGRMGGDEFVALAIDEREGEPSDEWRRSLVLRIEEALANYNLTTDKPFRLASSIGYAVAPAEQPRSLDALLVQADRMMLSQKAARKAKRDA